MSTFTELLSLAKELEYTATKDGRVITTDVSDLIKQIVQNLEHEVAKEVPAAPTTSTADVQKSSDLT